MKKIILFFLAFVVLSVAGCTTDTGQDAALAETPDTPNTQNTTEVSLFTPGTFTATQPGFRGDITVESVFSENRIEAVTVLEHVDSPHIAELPVSRIPAQVVASQSLAVDTIAGATVTSMAIRVAIMDTVTQAGGNVNDFMIPAPAVDPNLPITIETDVLVVGSGIAGLSAAIEARLAGASVIVIETLGSLGGNTGISGGIIQGADTSVQRAAGVEDSAEAYEQYLMAMARGLADPDMIRHIAHTSADMIDWLIYMGVNFSPYMHEFNPRTRPMRAHQAVETFGYGITMPMVDFAESIGVEFMIERTAYSLITYDGAVTGVMSSDGMGGPITINALAVVLATGGFDRNMELMARYQPLISNPWAVGIVSARGDGLLMGIEVGADTVMRDGAIAFAGSLTDISPGIFVGPDGMRFVDETEYGFFRTAATIEAGHTHFYNILDASMVGEAETEIVAYTIEDLAEMLNMDQEVLQATIDRYNQMVAAGTDTDFNKPTQYLQPVIEAPFAAIPFVSYITTGTFGGLKINVDGHVINTEGNVIPGLFAAGEVANGQFLVTEYGGSGTALITYGTMARNAGIAAARFALH